MNIDKICDELLAEGGDPEIVKIMRANMRAQRAFEEGGASTGEAMQMVEAARGVQYLRKASDALERFNARRQSTTGKSDGKEVHE